LYLQAIDSITTFFGGVKVGIARGMTLPAKGGELSRFEYLRMGSPLQGSKKHFPKGHKLFVSLKAIYALE
jgi:hypothetical protein